MARVIGGSADVRTGTEVTKPGLFQTAAGVVGLGVALAAALVADPLAYRLANGLAPGRRAARQVLSNAALSVAPSQVLKRVSAPFPRSLGGLKEDHLHVVGSFSEDGQLIARPESEACTHPPAFGRSIHPTASGAVRSRSSVDVVCLGDSLAVRKRFRGADATSRYVRELAAFAALDNSGVVPAVLCADPSTLEVFTEYVGRNLEVVLRDDFGAPLHGSEIRERSGREMSLPELEHQYYSIGAQAIAENLPEAREQIAELVRQAHRAGVVIRSSTYSNMTMDESGRLRLIDLDAATVHRNPQSLTCLVDRDRDVDSLNRAFGLSELTYQSVRDALATLNANASLIYAPFYLRCGLRLGNLVNPSSGFGKWHFLLKRVLTSARIGTNLVSLGTNNCSIELELLRRGARSVTCYESDDQYLEQARFLHRSAEWADNKSYDLQLRAASMERVVDHEERYDTALALCSLYYLPADAMATVIKSLASRVQTIGLQCNTGLNIGRASTEDYDRASVQFARTLLRAAGLTRISEYAPARYSRPLLLGTHSL